MTMDALENTNVLFEELETLRPLSKEDEQRIMQKFRLDWNYHSNHLEGNQLTFGETKALLLFNITAQGKPLKDHIEMTGHNEAIEWIIDVIKEERPMNESFICQLHQLLLKEPYEVDAITPDGQPTKKMVKVGEYKSTPNHVLTATGEIFRFASPEETPSKMRDLIEWFREEKEKQDRNAVMLAAEFHYRFIRIHPFDDSNGRLARILMNFILMSFHYPPVVIKTEDKENYFSVLRLADAGQIEPFIEYIANNLNHSLELMIHGAKGEDIEEPDDLEKEIRLLKNKITAVGDEVRTIKNHESISMFIEQNTPDLFKIFDNNNSLFNEYFFEQGYTIHVDGRELKYPNQKPYFTGSFGFKDNSRLFTITSFHHVFKRSGFDELTLEGRINFMFNNTNIKIFVTSPQYMDFELSKKYDEKLTKNEIERLVRPIARAHKDKIEEWIDNKNIKGLS